MLMTLAATTGLVIWLVLWSLGAKGFDSFMITALVLVVGATAKILLQYAPTGRSD